MKRNILALALLLWIPAAVFSADVDLDVMKETARTELARKVESIIARACGSSCGEFRIDLSTGLVSERAGQAAPGFESVAAGPKRMKITQARITLLVEEGFQADRLLAEVKAAATQVVDFPVSVRADPLKAQLPSPSTSNDWLAWAKALVWPVTLLLLASLALVAALMLRKKPQPEEIVAEEAGAEVAAAPVLAKREDLARLAETHREDLRFWFDELSRADGSTELRRLASLSLFLPDLSGLGLTASSWKAAAAALENVQSAEDPTVEDQKWFQLQLARARVRRLAAQALPADRVRSAALEKKTAWMSKYGAIRSDEASVLLFLTEESAWPRLLAPLTAERRLALLRAFHDRAGQGELEEVVHRVSSQLATELTGLSPQAERDWAETLSRFVSQTDARRLGMSVHGAPALSEAIRALGVDQLRELCFEMDVAALAGVWDQADPDTRQKLMSVMPASLKSRVVARAHDLRGRTSEVERRRAMLEAQSSVTQFLWKQGMIHEAQA